VTLLESTIGYEDGLTCRLTVRRDKLPCMSSLNDLTEKSGSNLLEEATCLVSRLPCREFPLHMSIMLGLLVTWHYEAQSARGGFFFVLVNPSDCASIARRTDIIELPAPVPSPRPSLPVARSVEGREPTWSPDSRRWQPANTPTRGSLSQKSANTMTRVPSTAAAPAKAATDFSARTIGKTSSSSAK
jgi:hypothetical protein